jgi:hypothetical protein
MPAGTLVVAVTGWPLAVKTVVSGILLFGFEILLVPAVALMGKDNFERIWVAARTPQDAQAGRPRRQDPLHVGSPYVRVSDTLCLVHDARVVFPS